MTEADVHHKLAEIGKLEPGEVRWAALRALNEEIHAEIISLLRSTEGKLDRIDGKLERIHDEASDVIVLLDAIGQMTHRMIT